MLSKFIDSLHVHFYRAAFREVQVPVFLNGTVEKHNVIVMLNSGHMVVGDNEEKIQERGFYVFPSGQPIYVKHGTGQHRDLGQSGFINDEHRANFLRTVSTLEDRDNIKELFTVVAFDAMIYDAIPFFEVLEIPPFYLPPDEELGFLIKHITCENELEKLGRDKIISNYMEEIMIHICRYMESQQNFKKYVDKLDFLTDRRLVDIVKYIRENLEKDLSNKAIASVAFISEDYVGQFFKSLTGKNLQDYIENQRLERALFLLRTQPDNIQEIAHRVGFKDPAYFSRRFKMKFGSNANAVRHNKNQMV
jgi:AraC-like DNA-binding protein